MSERMLTVSDINVYYGAIHAIKNVSFEVDEGEVVALIGANGAGKSTLLRTIAGEKSIGKGSILFEGKPLPPKVHLFSERGISLSPRADESSSTCLSMKTFRWEPTL